MQSCAARRSPNFLLAQHKKQLRYFRYPYLDTGRDLQTRMEADAFLVARGYRLAHVTLDGWDWAFARVYDDAKKRGDTAGQQEIANAYLSYSAAVFEYDEKLSRDLIGYEPKQIILLHANNLEADHIGELLDLLRKRGYRFITLEDALSDQAYGMPDTYVGEQGAGWLERWAISRGRPPIGAPVFPPAIAARSKALAAPPSTAPVAGPGQSLKNSSNCSYVSEYFFNRVSANHLGSRHIARLIEQRIHTCEKSHGMRQFGMLREIRPHSPSANECKRAADRASSERCENSSSRLFSRMAHHFAQCFLDGIFLPSRACSCTKLYCSTVPPPYTKRPSVRHSLQTKRDSIREVGRFQERVSAGGLNVYGAFEASCLYIHPRA